MAEGGNVHSHIDLRELLETEWCFKWNDRVQILPASTVNSICKLLRDQDLEKLADYLGLSVQDIQLLETKYPEKDKRACGLINEWAEKPSSTARILKDALATTNREDLVKLLISFMKYEHSVTVVLHEEMSNGTLHEIDVIHARIIGKSTLGTVLTRHLTARGYSPQQLRMNSQGLPREWWHILTYQVTGRQIDLVVRPSLTDNECSRKDFTGARVQSLALSSTSSDTPGPISVEDASSSEEQQPAIMRSVKGRSGRNSQDGPHTSTAVSSVASSGVYSAGSLLSVASCGVYDRAALSRLLSLISAMDDGASRDHIQEVTAGMGSLSLAIDDHSLPTLPKNRNEVLGRMDGFLERDGSYILWQLSSDHLNMLLLSVVYQNCTIHFPVVSENISDQVRFCLAQDTYRAISLSDLISHYHDQPLPHKRIDPTLVLTQLIQESSC